MTALYASIEPTDDPDVVSLRTSATPNPGRKPAMLIRRDHLDGVLLMLLDAAAMDTGRFIDPHGAMHSGAMLDIANRPGA
jgi:hypothetical protein